MKTDFEKRFDAYIKKTIIHTIISFARTEKKKQREVSMEVLKEISIDTNNSLAFFDCSNLEDYFTDSKLAKIIKNLKEDRKNILKLKFIDNYSTREIAKMYNRSEDRMRHIISETLTEIKRKYEEK